MGPPFGPSQEGQAEPVDEALVPVNDVEPVLFDVRAPELVVPAGETLDGFPRGQSMLEPAHGPSSTLQPVVRVLHSSASAGGERTR